MAMPRGLQREGGAGRAARHVGPDGVAGRRQRGMRQLHAERLADHLRGGRGAQELAAAAGRGAGAAQASAASSRVIWPWAKRAPTDCTLPASSPSSASRVTPPGTSTQGRSRAPASAIIMAGRPLSQVATPSTPRARGQRADQAAEDRGGVVAVGQGIEHAGGALGAAVAGVGAIGGEGHGAERSQVPWRRPP